MPRTPKAAGPFACSAPASSAAATRTRTARLRHKGQRRLPDSNSHLVYAWLPFTHQQPGILGLRKSEIRIQRLCALEQVSAFLFVASRHRDHTRMIQEHRLGCVEGQGAFAGLFGFLLLAALEQGPADRIISIYII